VRPENVEPPGEAAPAENASPARHATEGETERRHITGRAGIVASGTLLSRLLGLGRDQVLAAAFTRGATDAFFVAWVIPNVLRQLLAEGAVQSAVVPVLAEVQEQEGETEARRYFRALRGLSLVILLAVAVAGVLGAPYLVDLFAAGYKSRPGEFARTVTLTRWVFPYIFFMGTAALGVAALNTNKRFVVTSFAPALLNVSFIALALLLPGWLGAHGRDRILAMAFGALIGGALQVVAQWPSLKKIGYLELPRIDFRHPAVKRTLRRMVPVLGGVGIYYIDVLLSRRFLSELGTGAQSYFGFALRLCDFPQGIFVMALQTATLPSLSLLAASGQKHEVQKTFAFGMRLSLFVGFAATALVVALAGPLVVLIFERGHFGAEAASQTARALVALGLGIWMVAAVRQLVAVYYALGDTKTPVIVSGIDLVAFIVLALWLRGPLGYVGICLAVTGSSAVQMLLLWLLLPRRLGDTRFGEVARSALRTLGAALPAALVAIEVARVLGSAVGHGPVARMLPGAAAAIVFAAVFLLAARLFRSEELATLGAALKRRRQRSA
jgi:putative peptidoglycan lipid II flippase